MVLHFITGNSNKFREAKSIIPFIEKLDIELPEIQELDPKKVIEEKLKEAIKKYSGEFFCGDTSIYINCLNGFPGPLIKWFLKALGNKGIYELVSKYEDKGVVAKTVIGYADGKTVKFFEGVLKGEIVSPRGKENFGWDPIFKPLGFEKTLAEMSLEEKNEISMRKKALEKLKEYLESKN